MKPALTPEEWGERRFATCEPRISSNGYPPRMFGSVYEDPLDPETVFIVDRNDTGMGLADENRHALAALALYGQPFGFTLADVRWLRDVIRFARGHGAYEDELEQGQQLSDRIEALLPPAPTTSPTVDDVRTA